MTLSEELQWRGFVNQTTLKNLSELDGEPITFYWGVDPSADSMTIGNLAAAMMARHFIDHGHKAVLLVGGATGMIGDPDGKSTERDLMTLEQIQSNKKSIANQYSSIFAGKEFKLVDNYDWFKDMNYLTFLREVGKHVPMRVMLNREFVQSRLGEDGAGISYAEFSYSLIQGYDFLWMYQNMGVTMQLCGADQWGNSIAGVDLIRRIAGGEAHVYSTPLVVNKTTGVKFGKTEKGAVWLDANKTSPNDFYQFWVNLEDEGIEDYLKVYTLLEKDVIEGIINEHRQNPSNRIAQKALAMEVTAIVHGRDEAEDCETYVDILNGKELLENIGVVQEDRLRKNNAYYEVSPSDSVIDVLVESNLTTSKGEARRLIQGGGVSVNGSKIFDDKFPDNFVYNQSLESKFALLRKGKKLKDSVILKIK